MTNQEAFDRVVLHLKKQGRQSANDKGRCRYAGPNGTACAIGCLLPRELGAELDEFEPSITGLFSGSHRLKPVARQVQVLLEGLSENLLEDLQSAHDYCTTIEPEFWDDLEPKLKTIAENYKLTMPEL